MDELPDFMNLEGEDLANDEGNLFGEPDADNNDDEKAASGTKVSPKRRTVRNPRSRLSAELLCGNRGIQYIEDYFKDIKSKGKGREAEDLDEVMRRLQHWAHRLYPAFKFDDALMAIERLGSKRPVQVHMSRYRLGLLEKQQETENMALEENFEKEDERDNLVADEPFDEMDALLDKQISISRLDPKTPTHKGHQSKFATPGNRTTPYSPQTSVRSSVLAKPSVAPPSLSEEQKAKMAENRRLAKERLEAKKRSEQQQIQVEVEAQVKVEAEAVGDDI